MTSTLNFSYPLFVPNQVLRSTDLNNIVNYLDGQNRLTRTHLFGIGIVFGLQPEWKWLDAENRNRLTITPGLGLTSKGYLFNIEECILRSYSKIDLDLDKFFCEGESVDPNAVLSVWELSENKNGTVLEEGCFEEVDSEGTDGKVIMFYWDQEQNIRESCFTECDDSVQGEVKVVIRKFAISPEDACKITRYLCERTGDVLTVLPDICLKRFGFVNNSAGNSASGLFPGEIEDFQQFFDNYKHICNTGVRDPMELIGDIVTAYSTTEHLFKDLFELDESFADLESHLLGREAGQLDPDGNVLPEVIGLLQQLEENDHSKKSIQYFYDFLKDLVLTYEEFVGTRFSQQLSTRPDPCLFPNHILLGRMHKNGLQVEIDDAYRTKLIRPPIEGLENSDFNLAKNFFKKMVFLTRSTVEVDNKARFTHVEIPGLGPNSGSENSAIKITPSKGKWFPLSMRAIPYYYREESVNKKNGKIREYWNYEARVRQRQERIPAYYPVPFAAGPFLQREGHLFCDMDAYNFFRIEGHLYWELEKALKAIKEERQRFNLPFDIRCVKLDLDKEYIVNPDCEKFQMEMPDLELDYQKCRIELLCNDNLQGEIEEKSPEALLIRFLKEAVKVADFVIGYVVFEERYDKVFNLQGEEFRLDCKKECFKIIKNSYETRCEEIIKQLRFPTFAGTHPGLEHRAGVQKGGTFILAYTDTITDRNSLYALLAEKVPEPELDPRTGVIIPKAEFEEHSKNDAGLIYLASKYKIGLNFIKEQVIADFCLPYYCCSQVPVIQYVLSKSPPIILLAPDRFCSNDENKYPITYLPEDGHFEPMDWIVQDDEGKYCFQPSAVPTDKYDNEWIAKVEIVYICGDQIATKEVIVYRQPVAGYAIEVEREALFHENDRCLLIGYAYTFKDTSQYAHSVEWRINNEIVGAEPTLRYETLFGNQDFPFILNPSLTAYAKFETCEDSYRSKPISVECPTLEIEPLGQISTNDNDVDPDGNTILTYNYEKSLPPSDVPQAFTLRVDPFGDLFEITRFAINPATGNLDPNPIVVNSKLLERTPETGNDPCSYFFVYNQVLDSTQADPTPPGLYRFRYRLNCNRGNFVDAWVRLTVEEPEDNNRTILSAATTATEGNTEEASNSAIAENITLEEPARVATEDTGGTERGATTVTSRSAEPEEAINGFIVFNRRLTARRERLTELETDSSLTQTKTFRESKAFELFDGRDIPLLEKRFDDVMNLLINSNSRASGTRKEQYTQLKEIVLHGFSDKIVAARPNKVPDSTRTVFRVFIPRLNSKGLDVEAIRVSWNGAELKEATGALAVDELEELFKST
ncbi:MAG: hypothetical protein DHS20C18_34790 [Saprospiraceae bacterium]|nr:MAG: hypothetical protein DHS20C18_34790 [Saprospiraceae bacterium]